MFCFQVKDSLNPGRLKEKNSVNLSFSFDRDPAHQIGAVHNKHSRDFGTQVELTSSEFCLLGLWGSTRDHSSCSIHHSTADAVLETAVLAWDIQQLYQNIRSANSSKGNKRVQLKLLSQGSFPYHKRLLRDNRRSFPLSFYLFSIHLGFPSAHFQGTKISFFCDSVIFPKAFYQYPYTLPTPSSTDATITPEKPVPFKPHAYKTNTDAAPFGSRSAPWSITPCREVWKALGHPAKAQPRQGSQSGFTGAWPQGAFDLQSSRKQQGRSVWGYTTCKDTGRCTLREREAEGFRMHVWGACQQMASGNHKSICWNTASPSASLPSASLPSSGQHSLGCNTRISTINALTRARRFLLQLGNILAPFINIPALRWEGCSWLPADRAERKWGLDVLSIDT